MDKQACIFYADWFEGAKTIEDPVVRCQFYEYILALSLDDEEMELPENLRIAAIMVKSRIERNNEKRQEVIQKRRAAANSRWSREARQQQKPEEITPAESSEPEPKESPASSPLKNIPPDPPQNSSGKSSRSFGNYLARLSSIVVPPEVLKANGENQYMWRMTENNPGYGKAIADCIALAKGSIETLKEYVIDQNKRFTPKTSWEVFCFAKEMVNSKLTQAQTEAFVKEIDVRLLRKDPDVWKTMEEKLKYVKSGKPITSLAAFLRARNG